MTSAPNNSMTPQECKQYAMQLISRAWALPYHTAGEDRANMLAEAQVWATLATVPEPLEPLVHTIELVAGERIPELPNLICPHGFTARLSSNTAEPGERPRLKYSWTDCETCP